MYLKETHCGDTEFLNKKTKYICIMQYSARTQCFIIEDSLNINDTVHTISLITHK